MPHKPKAATLRRLVLVHVLELQEIASTPSGLRGKGRVQQPRRPRSRHDSQFGTEEKRARWSGATVGAKFTRFSS